MPHFLSQDTQWLAQGQTWKVSISSDCYKALTMTQSTTTSMHHVTFGSGLKAEAKWRWKNLPKEKLFMKNLSQRMLFPLKVNKYSVCHTNSDKLANELSLETACETSHLLVLLRSLFVPSPPAFSLLGNWTCSKCESDRDLHSGFPVTYNKILPSAAAINYNRGTGCWTLEVNSDDFWQACPIGKQTNSFCLRLQVISPCRPLWLENMSWILVLKKKFTLQESNFTLQ